MTNYEDTKTDTVRGGKKDRVVYREYDNSERAILRSKLVSDRWEDLGFLDDFWNIVHDESDLEQYRRMAGSWQHMSRGRTYPQIAEALSILERKARAYVRGDNCPSQLGADVPHSREARQATREAWKWILECTPKPTNPNPKALLVPNQIRDYNDIQEFLKQFPPIPQDSDALKFFGLKSEWAEQKQTSLFGHLLGFVVGDAGKNYPEYEKRSRHYRKMAFNTNMSTNPSNYRVLWYTQLCLEKLGISSHEGESKYEVIRWQSRSTNLNTWMIQSLSWTEGRRANQYTSLRMDWIQGAPKEFILAFLQGLADSDGNVNKYGYHANISSVPNTLFYKELFEILGVEAHAYPKDKPQQVRVWLEPAIRLPFFNPIIRSYRYEQLIQHGIRRKLIL